VRESKEDFTEESQNTIFNFTEVVASLFKLKFKVNDCFPCEFINHIFLPHTAEMKEKSLDYFSNIVYHEGFIDKLRNRNEFLFFLTLVSKSL